MVVDVVPGKLPVPGEVEAQQLRPPGEVGGDDLTAELEPLSGAGGGQGEELSPQAQPAPRPGVVDADDSR